LTKDGKEVKFTSVEGDRHIYSLAEVKPEHQGVYKLTAKNKTSAEETSITLNITGLLNLFYRKRSCWIFRAGFINHRKSYVFCRECRVCLTFKYIFEYLS
jgi:hypothetical protein